jgi:hypothetical protein
VQLNADQVRGIRPPQAHRQALQADNEDRSLFMTRNINQYFEVNTKSKPSSAYKLKEHFTLMEMANAQMTGVEKKEHTLSELGRLTGTSFKLPQNALPFFNPLTIGMLSDNKEFPTIPFSDNISTFFKAMSLHEIRVYNPLTEMEHSPSAMFAYLKAFMRMYNKVFLILSTMKIEILMTRALYHEFHVLTNSCLHDPRDIEANSVNEYRAFMPLNAVFMNQFFAFRTLNLIFENFKFHFEVYYTSYLSSLKRAQPAPPGLLAVKLEPEPVASTSSAMDISDTISTKEALSLMSISDDEESEDSDSRQSRMTYSSAAKSNGIQVTLSKQAKKKLKKRGLKTLTLQQLQQQQLKVEACILERKEQEKADEAFAKTIASSSMENE